MGSVTYVQSCDPRLLPFRCCTAWLACRISTCLRISMVT